MLAVGKTGPDPPGSNAAYWRSRRDATWSNPRQEWPRLGEEEIAHHEWKMTDLAGGSASFDNRFRSRCGRNKLGDVGEVENLRGHKIGSRP